MIYNRREFIRNFGVAVIAFGLPINPSVKVPEIIEYEIDDDILRQCIKMGKLVVNGLSTGIEVSFDNTQVIKSIVGIDSDGRRYTYNELCLIADGMLWCDEQRKEMFGVERWGTCARCHKSLHQRNAEICWYCTSYLCVNCWDEYGHCGHPEADELNEQSRMVEQE